MKKNKKTSIWILTLSLVMIISFSAIPQDVKASGWIRAWGQVRIRKNSSSWLELGRHNVIVQYKIGDHYGFPLITTYQVIENDFSDNFLNWGHWTLDWEEIDYDEFYMGASLMAVIITFTVRIYNINYPTEWTRYDFSVTIMADSLPSYYSYTLYNASIDDHIPGTTDYRVYGVTAEFGSDPVFLYNIVPA